MKAITLYQPWAWLVLQGWKEVETRGWYTDYRGPLAIHAGKHHDVDGKMLHLRMNSIRGMPELLPPFEELGFGCIVATCRLVACTTTLNAETQCKKLKPPFEPKNGWEFERHFGNYGPDRWAWILRAVFPVVPAVPARGFQKLWNWDDATVETVNHG